MAPDPTLLLKGFADLAAWWTDSVATRWKAMATKIDAGTYTGSDAASDAAYFVAVSTLGLLGAANEAMEAAGVLATNPGPTIASAKTQAANAYAADRPITIAGPFSALVGGGQIAATDMSASPPILPAKTVDFEVFANTTGHYASSYSGWVQVGTGTSASGTEMVAVTLIVQ
jgi:hypothetical protein